LHAEEIKLEGQIDLNNRQIEFNHERVTNIEQNNQKLASQKEELIQRCRTQQEKVEELTRALSSVEENVTNNREGLEEKKIQLNGLERRIQEAQDKIREHEEKTLGLTSNQISLRNDLTDVMKENQGAMARRRRLNIEQEKIICEEKEVNQKIESVNGQISHIQDVIHSLATEKSDRIRSMEESKTKLSSLGEQIKLMERKSLSLKSQKEFIEKLHDQYQDIPDPIVEGKLITQVAPLDHHTGILGKVKEVRPVQQSAYQKLQESFDSLVRMR